MPRVLPYRQRQPGFLFGLEFAKCLSARSLTPADLARMLARRRTPLSKSYLGYLLHNKRQVTPSTLDNIVATLAVGEDEAVRLHRAAALDAGFKIGGL